MTVSSNSISLARGREFRRVNELLVERHDEVLAEVLERLGLAARGPFRRA